MLAVAFGDAKVVPSTQFAGALADNQPVIIGVMPPQGGLGHEVVLTKTFQHNGQTWYEMMDSNQGPTRRLYLTQGELGTIQLDKGIVYRPEQKTTPALLR